MSFLQKLWVSSNDTPVFEDDAMFSKCPICEQNYFKRINDPCDRCIRQHDEIQQGIFSNTTVYSDLLIVINYTINHECLHDVYRDNTTNEFSKTFPLIKFFRKNEIKNNCINNAKLVAYFYSLKPEMCKNGCCKKPHIYVSNTIIGNVC